MREGATAQGVLMSLGLAGLLVLTRIPLEAQGPPKMSEGKESSGVVLRIWGVGAKGKSPLTAVLTKLEADYRKEHPEVSFTHHLSGNDSALGGVYVGAADVAFMDREPSYIELDGYQQVITGEKPFKMGVMRGGVQVANHSSPLVLVVNQKNPLANLSFSQLDAIFNAAHVPASHIVRTWGDLGLEGEWANQPLNLYGFEIEKAESRTFSKVAMADSRRWVCAYQEVKDSAGAENAAKSVVESVARDPYAMGVTTYDAVGTATKIVAVTEAMPTTETLSSGDYVLGQTVLVIARADKDGRAGARVRGFLTYLLSARAQAIIAADGSYVPLSEKLLVPERETLR